MAISTTNGQYVLTEAVGGAGGAGGSGGGGTDRSNLSALIEPAPLNLSFKTTDFSAYNAQNLPTPASRGQVVGNIFYYMESNKIYSFNLDSGVKTELFAKPTGDSWQDGALKFFDDKFYVIKSGGDALLIYNKDGTGKVEKSLTGMISTNNLNNLAKKGNHFYLFDYAGKKVSKTNLNIDTKIAETDMVGNNFGIAFNSTDIYYTTFPAFDLYKLTTDTTTIAFTKALDFDKVYEIDTENKLKGTTEQYYADDKYLYYIRGINIFAIEIKNDWSPTNTYYEIPGKYRKIGSLPKIKDIREIRIKPQSYYDSTVEINSKDYKQSMAITVQQELKTGLTVKDFFFQGPASRLEVFLYLKHKDGTNTALSSGEGKGATYFKNTVKTRTQEGDKLAIIISFRDGGQSAIAGAKPMITNFRQIIVGFE